MRKSTLFILQNMKLKTYFAKFPQIFFIRHHLVLLLPVRKFLGKNYFKLITAKVMCSWSRIIWGKFNIVITSITILYPGISDWIRISVRIKCYKIVCISKFLVHNLMLNKYSTVGLNLFKLGIFSNKFAQKFHFYLRPGCIFNLTIIFSYISRNFTK
jgi:hypothetical protein